MATYVNDLRLKEIATGDESGTWGTSTNTNLELIGESMGYGTEAVANASTHTITMADGATDGFRCTFLRLTGGGQACTVTLAPNTLSHTWIVRNTTSYALTFTQGSGANVIIAAGQAKIVTTDGLGSGAVVYECLEDLELGGTLTVGIDDTGQDVKFFGATSGKYLLWDESADSLLVNGDIDMVTNGNRIDLDTDNDTSIRASADDTITIEVGGSDLIALTSTSTFSCPVTVGVNDTGHDVKLFGATSGKYWLWDESADGVVQYSTLTVGVDDTGYDVKFFGATSGAYMLWDESADDLKLVGAAGLTVAGDADIDGTTNLDAVDIDGAVQIDAAFTSGVDGQGYDTKFFGDTASAYMLWDTSADDLILGGAAGLIVNGEISTTSAGTSNFRAGVNSGNSIASGGNYNVTIGDEAGTAITTGDNCTAVGYSALAANVDTSNNTAVGYSALAASTGNSNTAVGSYALVANTSANSNTALGASALATTTSGSGNNTACGAASLTALTTGSHNTAAGANALEAATDGVGSVAVGSGALKAQTTASNNTAVGRNAMDANTTGAASVAVGFGALGATIEAASNVAVGYQALTASTTGTLNVAVGRAAGISVTSGGSLTACGYDALGDVTTGSQNTGLGKDAGSKITEGSNNLCLGYDSGVTGSPGGNITTASNTVCIGDENIANAHIQVDWTVASDKRDKVDVEPSRMGLDFINKLAPVTYRWDKRSAYENGTPDGTRKEDWLDIGFLAQDVEALEAEYGYSISEKTNLATTLSDDGEQYGLQYSKFVPSLVKAVQELSARVAELEASRG